VGENMEINGWLFALVVVWLIVRNAWKYILIYKISQKVNSAERKFKKLIGEGEKLEM
jgi:hypothetical protein